LAKESYDHGEEIAVESVSKILQWKRGIGMRMTQRQSRTGQPAGLNLSRLNGSCISPIHLLYATHCGSTKPPFTHPNRFKNPNVSTTIPTNGHFRKTRRIPPKKQIVPRNFCFLAKK
jgi:hypothetical protein